MTFDDAQDSFRNDGVPMTAQEYLDTTIQYWEDDIIGPQTFSAAKDEIAEWCANTGSTLVDPRTRAQWVNA